MGGLLKIVERENDLNGKFEGWNAHFGSWFKWNTLMMAGCSRQKNGVFKHNHELGPKLFKTYALNRGVQNEGVANEVQAMIRHGCRRAKIYEYLLEQGENVVQKDVDNMVQAFKTTSKTDIPDEDACSVRLAEFAANEGNTVTVDETSNAETGVVNLSSRHMRSMFARFPELLLVDCTHKTNRFNYQLCTLMVIDEYGEGQPIQQSLLERNSDWHMACVLDHLERVNPGSAQKAEVIMVDKDLNEIRVLQTHFPDAQILVCAFHVIKYLKLASRKPEYGKISSSDHDDLDTIVHNMVYAASKLVYMENCASLKAFCQRTQFLLFFDYFRRNWDSSTEMWVLYKRAELPHFAVHTNNHLESWFGHFKKLVKADMSMLECIEALIGCDTRAENEYLFRWSRVGLRVNHNYDAEMNQVLRFTTHFVASHIEKQYIKAMAKFEQFAYDSTSTPGCVIVKDSFSSYTVRVDTHECTCSFSCSMKLPCQHAIAYCKVNQCEECIPLSRIHDRWIKASDEDELKQRFVFKAFSAGGSKHQRLSTRQKYKEALSVLQVVCSELADIQDDDEYHEHLDFVLNQWRNVRQRKRIQVVESAGENVQQDRSGTSKDDVDSSATLATTESPKPTTRIAQQSEMSSGNSGTKPAHIRLAFNPHVISSGRPHLDRELQAATEKQKRSIINETERHRRHLGEITLVQLSASLEIGNPSIADTVKRIEPLQVRYKSAAAKKPSFHKQRSPVLNENAFFLLPVPLLKKCFELLPTANQLSDAIFVGDSSESEHEEKAIQSTHVRHVHESPQIEYITITGIGSFSRAQIEAMMKLTTLRSDCEEGLDFCKWLERDVKSAVPASMQELVNEVSNGIAKMFPEENISSSGNFCRAKTLYRVMPPKLADGAFISAFCYRIHQSYPSVFLVGIATAHPHTRRSKRNSMDVHIKRKAKKSFNSRATLFIPVNFGNIHWCGIIVDATTRKIWLYDSMNCVGYKHALKELSQDLVKELEADFHIDECCTPVQFDSFSCGFFVCLKFMWFVRPSTSLTTTGNALLVHRFCMLYYMLYGHHCDDTQVEEYTLSL